MSDVVVNLTGVEAGSDLAFTSPGTIGVFTVSELKMIKSKDKGTPGLEVTFQDENSSFHYNFWLTQKALPRLQSLAKHATGNLLTGEMTEAAFISALVGKKVALKVSGRVGSNGKGYPELPYKGFAKPAEQVASLKFSSIEDEEIRSAIEAVSASSSAGNADVESAKSDDGETF